MKKTFLSIFFLLIIIINLIFIVSASEISGSFTITGEAVGDTEGAEPLANDSFLNSIKNWFIYAFNIGGEFEITSPTTTTPETGETGRSSGSSVRNTSEEDTSKSKEEIELNESEKINISEKDKPLPGIETPLKLKESEKIFIIVIYEYKY